MKQFKSRLGAVALALLVVIAAFAIALPASAQSSDVTEIDSCTTITDPGTYVLAEDITDSDEDVCIEIRSSDVTIDGDGHTIDGVDREGTDGIYAGTISDDDATTNVIVENVVLTDWETAVTYEDVEDSTIRDNTIESNGRAISSFFDSTNLEIADNALIGNDIGIDALGGRVTIVDTVASNEIDYVGAASEDEGAPDHSVENFTLDTATVSLENDIDQIDFFGGGASLDLSAVESIPDSPDGFANVGGYVEAAADSNADGSFTLSVHYDDDLDGVDEDSLQLYLFADGEWTEVPGSEVDTDANTVSAEFDDPSALGDATVLAPFGQVDSDGDAGDDGAGDGDDGGGSEDGDKSDDKKDDKNNGDSSDDGDIVDVGSKDIEIDLGDVTIADFELDGPGLADEHIDYRTYEVGGFDIGIDGLDLTIGDTHYRVGHVSITVEPFDVILENVTLGSGE